MASIAGRSGASSRFIFALVVLTCAGLLLSACSTGVEINDPSAPTPTIGTTTGSAIPTQLPIAGTQTAVALEVPYTIERVALSTDVDDDGSPRNEVSVLSQEQQNVYLTVLIRDVPAGTQFQALWQENEEVIGQSEERVDRDLDNAGWIVLAFRSIAELNPSASHSVELVINERSVNTFAFRVGVGNPADVIAETTFAEGLNEDGEPVAPRDEFDRFTGQIVLIARISNMVDPTGMIFTAHWMRGDVPLAQGTPDDGQPRLDGDQSPEEARLMTFTLAPQGNLIPGGYSVILRLNGVEIAEYEFVILTDDAASNGDAEPSPTPDVTPTPEILSAEVLNIVLAEDVDDDSSEPEDEIERLEGHVSQAFEVYAAIEFANLRVEDTVEVTVGIGNSIIERYQLPVAAREQGWLATEIQLRAPDFKDRSVTYEIIVFINGSRVDATTITVESTDEEAPQATPTPDPFDLRNDGDDDDEDDD